MSHISTRKTETMPNFIASEVGMIQRTWNFSDTGVTADADGYKTIKAGTVYPANDATAKGIVFENVDVTDGAHAGSLIIAGRLYSNRLPVAPDKTALTPLTAQGMYFDVADETTREDV